MNPSIFSFLTKIIYLICDPIRSSLIFFDSDMLEYNDIEGSLPTHYGLLANLQNMKFGKLGRCITIRADFLLFA